MSVSQHSLPTHNDARVGTFLFPRCFPCHVHASNSSVHRAREQACTVDTHIACVQSVSQSTRSRATKRVRVPSVENWTHRHAPSWPDGVNNRVFPAVAYLNLSERPDSVVMEQQQQNGQAASKQEQPDVHTNFARHSPERDHILSWMEVDIKRHGTAFDSWRLDCGISGIHRAAWSKRRELGVAHDSSTKHSICASFDIWLPHGILR